MTNSIEKKKKKLPGGLRVFFKESVEFSLLWTNPEGFELSWTSTVWTSVASKFKPESVDWNWLLSLG